MTPQGAILARFRHRFAPGTPGSHRCTPACPTAEFPSTFAGAFRFVQTKSAIERIFLRDLQTKLANIQADLQFRATNCDIHRLTPKYLDQTRQYPGMSLTWCYSPEHPGRLQISQISFQRDLSPYSQQDAKQIPPNDVARFSGLSVLMYATFA